MKNVALIMAGGSGDRFWPLSRRTRPKQLLPWGESGITLLEEAYANAAAVVSPQHVFVAVNELLQQPIQELLPNLPELNLLIEPFKRNTAACVALACARLRALWGDGDEITLAVLTADNRIRQPDVFRQVLNAGFDFVQTRDVILNIGLVPTRPETGYGYLEIGEKSISETEAGHIYRVHRFCEKPNLDQARSFVSSQRFLWNSGMFLAKVSTLLSGFEKHLPRLADGLEQMTIAFRNPTQSAAPTIATVFENLEDISIDYGLLEHATNLFVIKADFDWDDVGAWETLARNHSPDEEGNITVGEPILLDCKDSVVYNAPGSEGMAVAVIGVKDLVVATTPDGVLVCSRDKIHEIKKAVAELKKRGKEKFT